MGGAVLGDGFAPEHGGFEDVGFIDGAELLFAGAGGGDGDLEDALDLVREATDAALRRELQGAGIPFQTVYGQGEARLQQALRSIVEVLAEGGAKPEHLVRLTWYVTDKRQYLASLKEIGAAYKALIGRHYPAMALVQVVALVEDRAKVEIEATAVVPEGE